MDDLVKKEIKKTTKKAGGSFALWGIGALVICCGGPIVLLAIISGGLTGFLGLIFSNLFFVAIGLLIVLLAIALFYTKVMKIKKQKG